MKQKPLSIELSFFKKDLEKQYRKELRKPTKYGYSNWRSKIVKSQILIAEEFERDVKSTVKRVLQRIEEAKIPSTGKREELELFNKILKAIEEIIKEEFGEELTK